MKTSRNLHPPPPPTPKRERYRFKNFEHPRGRGRKGTSVQNQSIPGGFSQKRIPLRGYRFSNPPRENFSLFSVTWSLHFHSHIHNVKKRVDANPFEQFFPHMAPPTIKPPALPLPPSPQKEEPGEDGVLTMLFYGQKF